MKRLKFLHFGDLHLDMPFTSLGYGDSQSTVRRQDLLECFDRILELAKTESVNVILVSGDLFEHSYVRKSTIKYINEKFKQLLEIKIFIVPGNHDPLLTDSFYKTVDWSENVCILEDAKSCICLEEYGVNIYGKPFKSFYEKKSLIQDIEPVDRCDINILLIHGTVDMGIGQSDYNSMTSGELDRLGMDYIALGHFHNRIEALGESGVIYNPGSPEPLGFDEPGKHGVFIGTISKAESEIRSSLDIHFIETWKRFYKTIDINVSGLTSNEEILDRIALLLSQEDMERGLYDIRLKGYTDRDFRLDAKLLQRLLVERVFFLKIKDQSSIDFDIESISKEPGLKGLYVRKMLSQINSEQNVDKRDLFESALHFGLQALENGEIELE